jgi:predicted ATPase/DNA-binding winged helix-turn-helix (wHTH) protein
MRDETPGIAVSFGPFRLIPAERRLERDGVPVAIGDRALMILVILVERAGEVVGKRELIARAWPGTIVEEGNLRFQMVALRRALGDAQGGARYISTVPGRGYCFVAPIHRPDRMETLGLGHQQSVDWAYRLPPRLARMVGREDNVAGITAKLISDRFVSIVGPGGIGKTTVAVSVGHALLDSFDGAVCFVDLANLSDPALVPGALAAALGLRVDAVDPLASVIAALPQERMLIILDSCEHVIDQTALLAERIFETRPQIHLLTTSRESLRVEGEHTHRLIPLATPPEGELTAAAALAFPSVQLFVSRVAAVDDRFSLSDGDAPLVAEICRHLDGIALAIELAAGRVEAFGIQGTAARLGDRMELWNGRRTAMPRHQTLSATFDWSYELLSQPERMVLRRLSSFVGGFDLDAAETVASGSDLNSPRVIEALARLVAKSLVATETEHGRTRYRLLDTTRAYARDKLVESGEVGDFARHHAEYYRDLLAMAGPAEPERPPHGFAREIDNIRAALAWAFAPEGDKAIGVALAAQSAPVWLSLSLLTECRSWMARAAACFEAGHEATRPELLIQAALGSALMFTGGLPGDSYASWTRTLRLARKLKDLEHQLIALLVLWAMQIRRPVYADAETLAGQCRSAAEQAGAPGAIAMAQWMLGVTRHHLGRHAEARQHLRRALDGDDETARQIQVKRFGYDRRVDALAVLGNLLWVQGQAEQAAAALARAVAEARGLAHAVPLCAALAWKGFTLTIAGDDFAAAQDCAGELVELAGRHKVESYHGLGLCLVGTLQARSGASEPGLVQLAAGLAMLARSRYEVFHPIFMSEQLRILARTGGRAAECHALLDSPHLRLDAEHWCMPEVLRIRGEIARSPPGDGPAAEALFTRALDLARRQKALSWENRAATSLAQLWADQGRYGEAQALLAATRDQFIEGLGSADFRRAGQLLAELARRRA